MTDEIRTLVNLFNKIKRKIYFPEQSKRAVVYLTCIHDMEVLKVSRIIKAFVVQVLCEVAVEYWQQQNKANQKSNVLL